jgi:sterol desaturase/sphingolipid hydroxylase (fatty acid hydroxylase superfamily)
MKPYVRNERARMFDSDFFEMFSKVHPATPFVLYIPPCVALLVWSLFNGVTSALWTVVFFPVGFVAWQFTEYFVHKKLFHWEGSGPFTRWLHQILHGYHHQYPDDEQRLVMPIGASLPAAALIAFLLWLMQAPAQTIPLFVGFIAAYLFYDFTHWSTHYRKPLTAWGKAIRSHHMAHHFADTTRNFGISHRWLDGVLGTLKTRDPGSKS